MKLNLKITLKKSFLEALKKMKSNQEKKLSEEKQKPPRLTQKFN